MNIALRILYNVGLTIDTALRLSKAYWAMWKARRMRKKFEARGMKVYK